MQESQFGTPGYVYPSHSNHISLAPLCPGSGLGARGSGLGAWGLELRAWMDSQGCRGFKVPAEVGWEESGSHGIVISELLVVTCHHLDEMKKGTKVRLRFDAVGVRIRFGMLGKVCIAKCRGGRACVGTSPKPIGFVAWLC